MDFFLARAKVAAARAKVPRQCSKVQSRSNEKHVGCDACCDEEKANDPHLVATRVQVADVGYLEPAVDAIVQLSRASAAVVIMVVEEEQNASDGDDACHNGEDLTWTEKRSSGNKGRGGHAAWETTVPGAACDGI